MRKKNKNTGVKVSKKVKSTKKVSTIKWPLSLTIPVYQMGNDEPEQTNKITIEIEEEEFFDDTLTATKALYKAFSIAEQENEFNYLVTFDENHCPLGIYVSPEGEAAAVEFSYEDIFLAIKRDHATYVITAHNHPGELEPVPSDSDIRVFRNFRGVMKDRLIDNIILGKDRDLVYSLKERGFFDADDVMVKLYNARTERYVNEGFDILLCKIDDLESKLNKIMEKVGISEE